MERIKEVTPAYDRRNPNPEIDYGIHGVELRYVLRGPLGAVQFVLYTNRQLPHVQEEMLKRILVEFPEISKRDQERILNYSGPFPEGQELVEVDKWEKFLFKLELAGVNCLLRPMAADIGYHSPKPLYEGQTPIRKVIRPFKFEDGVVTEAIYGESIPCPYVGNECYYDGSSLAAEEFYKILLRDGLLEESIWNKLEEVYNNEFERVVS